MSKVGGRWEGLVRIHSLPQPASLMIIAERMWNDDSQPSV